MIKDRLKEIRENVHMDKNEFSNYIGIESAVYDKYESGVCEPGSDFLVLMAEKLNVSTDYILGLSDVYNLKKSE